MFDIEFENNKITQNFHSKALVKDLKLSLKKDLLKNKQSDKMLIKLYIDGKEINDENINVGKIVESEKAKLYVACITLSEDIENDNKKINEKLIKNLSKNCPSHKESKALNICIKCSDSFCDECIPLHPLHENHKIISKNEIVNFEENLREINSHLSNKFIAIGLEDKDKENGKNKLLSNQDLINSLSQNISKKCEILIKGVEEIKKKETFIMNKLKFELEENLPITLDYKDKIYKLHQQITENEKEIILRNDNEFIDFYLKYNQI